MNLKTVDSKGEALVDVVDNYVRQRNTSVVINSRPGRYQVQVATADEIYPPWALECLSRQGDLTQLDPLDVQVLEPGVVKVRGIFLGEGGGVVIDEEQILLLSRKTGVVLSMKVNSPGRATFMIMDVIDQSAFSRFIPADFW